MNEAVLQQMDRTVGIASIRALQALERRGPLLVTELGNELDMLASTASRLSDRLADAQLITRHVAPTNRRATQLQLAAAGRDILTELTEARTTALHAVTQHLSAKDRTALLTGARAFSHARNERLDQPASEAPRGSAAGPPHRQPRISAAQRAREPVEQARREPAPQTHLAERSHHTRGTRRSTTSTSNAG
ncbi:DNA-binding MarR family transcriptional regulator [Pseudonocardia eucalypti]|nr:DNA-binding MarR family transcriptional regulator [Pseudonocardia eucalypti]